MTNQEILNSLFENGKLNHYCLKKDWYINNELLDVYANIVNNTNFLNENSSLRERIFYIEQRYDKQQTCPYCQSNPLIFNKNKVSLSKHCGNVACKSQHTSLTMKKRMSSLSVEDRNKIVDAMIQGGRKRINEITGKTFEEIYGNEKANQIKAKISNSPIHQCEKIKQKRIQTRKNNKLSWHSPSTIEKIRKSNIRTHTSSAFREKYKHIYDLSRAKQSKTMKEKILKGEFTPPITNSWTHWNVCINVDGNLKKFRSSWEAAYWLKNRHLEYEKIRIPYESNDGKQKVYIVDFVDHNSRKLIEIKPNSLLEKNKIKIGTALKWCDQFGYNFEIVGDDWFKQNITEHDVQTYPEIKNALLK